MARATELILLALISVAAISLYNLESKSNSQESLKFEVWKQAMNKNYDNMEHSYRFGIWMNNLKYVEEHNQKYYNGEETYELEMNLFADLTSEEFGAKYLGYDAGLKATSKCTGSQAPSQNLPDEVDWSAKGATTPIKNQGQCGSCWAFSTTGSIEGAHFLSSSKLSSFSEQQLVDCSKEYGNHGCQGGLMDFAFYYIKDHGITLESSYPYKGVNGQCHYDEKTDSAWTISDCTDVTVDKEAPLVAAVAQQPVSVAIQANHISFQLYKKGVYTGNCGTKLDHGVLAYGYGEESGKKYWKVKNSWGAGWGQAGSINIERTGDGKGKCGINMSASFPIA